MVQTCLSLNNKCGSCLLFFFQQQNMLLSCETAAARKTQNRSKLEKDHQQKLNSQRITLQYYCHLACRGCCCFFITKAGWTKPEICPAGHKGSALTGFGSVVTNSNLSYTGHYLDSVATKLMLGFWTNIRHQSSYGWRDWFHAQLWYDCHPI